MRVFQIAYRSVAVITLAGNVCWAQDAERAGPTGAEDEADDQSADAAGSKGSDASGPEAADEEASAEEVASEQADGTAGQGEPSERAPKSPRIVCGLDSYEGIAESDARAAAAMICQELRRYGQLEEDHDGSLPPAKEGYRIRAYRLGKKMLLELSYEQPVGQTKESVRVEFGSAEELADMSTKMVLALKEGKPIEDTSSPPDTATQDVPDAQDIEDVLMYAGIVGFTTVGDLSGTAGGADLGLSVAIGSFSFTPYGRLAFGEAQMGALGIDLRYFLSDAANSVFLGAGMGAMGLGVDRSSGGGPVGSMLFGVEFNRRARSRVGFNLRADFPVFTLDSPEAYVVPVGANLYVTL